MTLQKNAATQLQEKYHAIKLSTSAVRVNNETMQIDPQLLFQRLITAGTRNDQLEDIFPFELCSYPSAIFEATSAMMPSNKPALADAIWALVPRDVVGSTGQSQYMKRLDAKRSISIYAKTWKTSVLDSCLAMKLTQRSGF